MQKLHNISVKILAYIGAALAGLLLTNPSWAADSISWSAGTKHNNHSYQSFEVSQISWDAAQYKCDGLGGYLATITTKEEQGFVAANFLVPSKGFKGGHHIGGFKDTNNKWHWITTGEPWSYNNLYVGAQGEGTHLAIYGNGWWLRKNISADIDGYICEWNSKKTKILSSAVVDIDGNGTFELATLYQNTKTNASIVEIKDLTTNVLLSTLNFSAGTGSALGMVVLKNIETSNTTPEIGVLRYTGTKSIVQIKDVKDDKKTVGSITFLDSTYVPKAISVAPDVNHNGSNEITVFGTDKTTPAHTQMETRDSKTTNLLQFQPFF
ncbi:exported hypothetical protein [Crenothrix polyspora]|uniref:C-type lectin domain-containing protein n=1 Tax=Crenothrix polyspora TaxID=360316 RepID=A0A1R4HH04_9GAMM|nr:C-type lectin domain-containing protein [Crenothrix polyspora]SJM95528.1 exported hypothetical protein [Crenothrix polyspora]